MSILVKNVSKKYGDQLALDDVSFEIQRGEVVGFLGPNGAGKSTMMKIITCYIPPTGGTVEVHGMDVMDKSLDVRRRIGYLPEHNPLYLDMYVREYLSFTGELYKVKNLKNRVAEMIDMVGLGPEAHKKIEALSKGYRQRVGLAQSMIHNPDVLILDEPTSGLDPNQLDEIRSLIRNIGKEKTVMLSTHIMQEVEAICSRTIIINKGKIVADAQTASLRSGIGKEGYELLVEFSGPVHIDLIRNIEGVQSVSSQGNNTYIVRVATNDDIRVKFSHLASSQNVAVLTLSRRELKMEDIFKEVTR